MFVRVFHRHSSLVFGFPFGVASVPVTCDPAGYLRSEFCARRRVGQNRARAPTSLPLKLSAPSLILYLVIRSDLGHSADLFAVRYKAITDLNVVWIN